MIQGIGEAFEKMDKSSTNAAALIELMFGKNRANAGIALLNNYKQIDKVLETIKNDEGSAMEENQRYIDSIQGRLDILKNEWQKVWDTAGLKDFIKGVINLGTSILKVVNELGLMKSILLVFTATSILKNFNAFSKTIVGITEAIKLLRTAGIDATKVLKNLFGTFEFSDKIKEFKKGLNETRDVVKGLSKAEKEETASNEIGRASCRERV